MQAQQRRLKSEASFKLINQSHTNCSVSKQTHSFSKSTRFPPLKPQCPLVSYNGDSIKTKRGMAGIGVGSKSDFTKDLTCSPGCNKYEIRSQFERNLSSEKGCTVGNSRDKVTFASYINPELLRTPSSNRYEVNHEKIKARNPLFSIGSRTKLLNKSLTIESQNDNPGPGEYGNGSSWSVRKMSSPFGSSNLRFSADTSKRFPNFDNRIPGPASYEESPGLSKMGKYSISNHVNPLSLKFAKSERMTMFDEAAKKSREVPGAGSYRTPSQFGQYDEPQTKLSRIFIPDLRHSEKPRKQR